MILLTSSYKVNNDQRNEELLMCLKRNMECKAFTKIYLFVDASVDTTNNSVISSESPDLVERVITKERMTYQQFFNFANEKLENGTIVCLSNSDIWFDETLLNITEQQLDQRTFFACTRWGYMNDTGGWHWDEGYDKNASVSQDAWIFRTPVMWSTNLDFHMGRMRCDNVLAYAMHAVGYRVLNPTLPGPKSLKLHHEHRSQVHNYGTAVPGPTMYVHPCQLA